MESFITPVFEILPSNITEFVTILSRNSKTRKSFASRITEILYQESVMHPGGMIELLAFRDGKFDAVYLLVAILAKERPDLKIKVTVIPVNVLSFFTEVPWNLLKNAYELDLSGNDDIYDVSIFKNVRVLNLSGCGRIINVHLLTGVRELNMSRVKEVSGVSELRDLTKFVANGSHIYDSIVDFQDLEELDISNSKITNIARLPKLTILRARNAKFYRIHDIPNLQEVDFVGAASCL